MLGHRVDPTGKVSALSGAGDVWLSATAVTSLREISIIRCSASPDNQVLIHGEIGTPYVTHPKANVNKRKMTDVAMPLDKI
jgi:hypothetical protein